MDEVNEYVPTVVMNRTAAIEAINQDRRINAVAMESATQGARVAALEGNLRLMSREVSGCFAGIELLRAARDKDAAAQDAFALELERHHRRERRALALIIGLLVLVLWLR